MKRDREGAGHRHLRVQTLVLEELRALLRDDLTDPQLFGVRLVAAALSVDYRHAKIHFVLAGTNAAEPRLVRAALERATPFLRARLIEAIEMKRCPELRFVLDGVENAEEGGAPCSG